MSRKFLSTLRLTNLASDPEGGSEGDIYFNSITKALRFYNGSGWVELADTGIADQTQKYLFDHRHTYNGDISEIIPSNVFYPETMLSQAMNESIENPIIVLDGGNPTDFITEPTMPDFTLIDGGSVS